MPDYPPAEARLKAIRDRLAKFREEYPVEGIDACIDFLNEITEGDLRASIAHEKPVKRRESIRRTFFLPKYWTLRDVMHPEQTLSACLLTLHDEQDTRDYDEQEGEQLKLTLEMFSDELEQAIAIKRRSDGCVAFEIDLEGVPLGYMQQVGDTITLKEILETAWDVAADCTLDSDRWMSDWYATHVVIASSDEGQHENRITLRCVRASLE